VIIVIRRLLCLVLLALGAATGLAPALAAQGDPVVVVPITGTVDEGMASVVQRAVRAAHERHARAIVLDVDTAGGLATAAIQIHDALVSSDVPVYAYISQRAWAAGALIAKSAAKIEMAPGSSIGVVEPVMTADDATRVHLAGGIAPTQHDALEAFGLGGAPIVSADYSFGEMLARFATNPQISGILLAIGMLGLLIEMQTLHGIAGTIGVAALALFFGTHVYAGFSSSFVIALAIAGVIGILFELHVLPGHGVAGILGLLALFGSIVLAFGAPFVFVAVQSLAIAVVLTALLFVVATRIFPENAFMRRLVFTGVQGPEYVASTPNTFELIGHSGTAYSYLRPAGVAVVDGRRIDVLTEGEFVTAGTAVRVTRIEGSRIFVKPIDFARETGGS
jgi:membrane-bound serine protease (ClpP class)